MSYCSGRRIHCDVFVSLYYTTIIYNQFILYCGFLLNIYTMDKILLKLSMELEQTHYQVSNY